MRHLFTAHPASVGETYFEHLQRAFTFGITMVLGGFACLLHGLVPAWFVTTGSRVITRLHDQMVTNRRSEPAAVSHTIDFVI